MHLPQQTDDSARIPLAIGDVQGCRSALQYLLAKANPAAHTPIWFTGDLINRGTDSLGTLRDVISLAERVVTVLGNHELHLLGIAAGVRQAHAGDTLSEILEAPDAVELIDWIRHQPLAHYANGMLLVHAGVLPQWDLNQTLALARELEAALRAPNWKTHIRHLFGPQPEHWHDALRGYERLRMIANVFTRIRFCRADGSLELGTKSGPENAPTHLTPWFDVPGRRTCDTTIVFGHWAALGLMLRDNLCGLDSGCVWGKQLSAVSLHADPTKRRVTQVDCPQATPAS